MKPMCSLTGVVLLFALAVGLGCDRPEKPAAPLLPIPAPDLSLAEPGVREQLGTALEKLEKAPPPEPSAAAEAYGQLGLGYLLYDFLAAAEAAFVNADRLQPDDARWPYLHGYVLVQQGRLAEAIPRFEAALALRPDLQAAALRLARAHLETGDLDAAESRFNAVLGSDPDSPAALAGLGQIAAARGDDRLAVRHFTRALELAPAATSLHHALSQSYRRLGDFERAEQERAASGDVPVAIPDPLLQELAASAASAEFFLAQGGHALDDGDFQTAAGAFRRALELAPANLAAARGLSLALEPLGDLAGAEVALRQALAQNAASEDGELQERLLAHRRLATLLSWRGDPAGAVQELRQVLALAPDDVAVHGELGDALARNRDFRGAIEHYDQALARAPGNVASLRVRRATALANLGRAPEAIADFEQAIAVAPQDAALRLRFADLLQHLGNPERAAAERRTAADLGGDAVRAQLLAEEARRELAAGRYAVAVAGFESALALAPDLPPVRYELAALLGHLGRYAEAVGEFDQVLAADAKHLPAQRGRITALLLLERYVTARDALQTALRQFPLDAGLAHLQARLVATAPDPQARDAALAAELAERLLALHPDAAPIRETFALAHAAGGAFAPAIALEETLLAEAESGGDVALAARRRERLAAFRRGEAWVARGPEEILSEAVLP